MQVRVEAVDGGEFGLIAARAIEPGELVLRFNGRITRCPSRFTVQVGLQDHIEVDAACSDAELRIRYPWRYLNHHCDPNTMIRGMDVYATRHIESGSAITFDYDTTEAIVTEPFTCNCGSPSCRGLIRGFSSLSAPQQEALIPLLAPHLLALMNQGGVLSECM